MTRSRLTDCTEVVSYFTRTAAWSPSLVASVLSINHQGRINATDKKLEEDSS